MFIYRYKDIKKKYFTITLDKNIINSGIIAMIIILLNYYLNNNLINIFNLLFILLYSCIINKDMLKNIIALLKNKLKRGKT